MTHKPGKILQKNLYQVDYRSYLPSLSCKGLFIWAKLLHLPDPGLEGEVIFKFQALFIWDFYAGSERRGKTQDVINR